MAPFCCFQKPSQIPHEKIWVILFRKAKEWNWFHFESFIGRGNVGNLCHEWTYIILSQIFKFKSTNTYRLETCEDVLTWINLPRCLFGNSFHRSSDTQNLEKLWTLDVFLILYWLAKCNIQKIMAYIIIFLTHNTKQTPRWTDHCSLFVDRENSGLLIIATSKGWVQIGFNLRFAGKVLKETGHQGFTSRTELMITYAWSNYGTPLIIFLGG